MLYNLLKTPATIAIWLYCRQLRVSNKKYFNLKGPLLIACNHPDSFLDAIIIATLFKKPVYSLARGDAFNNKLYALLLRSMKMFPVYRTSEGVENMEHNYKTFEACREIFKKNGIVLIFSEGRCINEFHLRPLKKGTARLAISSWKEGIDLTVLPLGINYQGFQGFGKNVHLNFGNIISQKDIYQENGFGKAVQSFNTLLLAKLQPLVYEIEKNDIATLRQFFEFKNSSLKKILLAIPAVMGYIIHWPLYMPAKIITAKSSLHNDHYDSILVGILFVFYPFYLLLMSLLVYTFTGGWYGLLVFIVMPFCAWSYLQLKKQF